MDEIWMKYHLGRRLPLIASVLARNRRAEAALGLALEVHFFVATRT
jgi:hypothetical protein